MLSSATTASSAALLGTVIVERLIDVCVVVGLACLVLGLGGAEALFDIGGGVGRDVDLTTPAPVSPPAPLIAPTPPAPHPPTSTWQVGQPAGAQSEAGGVHP